MGNVESQPGLLGDGGAGSTGGHETFVSMSAASEDHRTAGGEEGATDETLMSTDGIPGGGGWRIGAMR